VVLVLSVLLFGLARDRVRFSVLAPRVDGARGSGQWPVVAEKGGEFASPVPSGALSNPGHYPRLFAFLRQPEGSTAKEIYTVERRSRREAEAAETYLHCCTETRLPQRDPLQKRAVVLFPGVG
jgi:hypothetical protein